MVWGVLLFPPFILDKQNKWGRLEAKKTLPKFKPDPHFRENDGEALITHWLSPPWMMHTMQQLQPLPRHMGIDLCG